MTTISLPTHVRQVVGSGPSANFIDLPKTSLVDGNVVNVTIYVNQSAVDNELANWKLTQMIKPYLVQGGLLITSRTVRIIFPPGSQNITYQPVFGFGPGPTLPVPAVVAGPGGMGELEAEVSSSTFNRTQHIITVATFATVCGLVTLAMCYNIGYYIWSNRQKKNRKLRQLMLILVRRRHKRVRN